MSAPETLPMTLELGAGQALRPCWQDRLWRVRRGALRRTVSGPGGETTLIGLARPGDWLNGELLVGPRHDIDLVALTVCELEGHAPEAFAPDAVRALLLQYLGQQTRMAGELACWRTGAVQERLRSLLLVLDDEGLGSAAPWPSLKDLGAIVAASPESVCRVLSRLRRMKLVGERSDRQAPMGAMRLEGVALPRGLTSSAGRCKASAMAA